MVTSIPLASVENLLNEFNYPSTTNSRKHEIEKQLIEFQNGSNAWSQCLHQLSNITNPFFWFFNASTIEAAITRKWKDLDRNDRTRLRDTLWTNYVNLGQTNVSRIQREKSAQLIALIGKRQFPDEHSVYMDQVVQLIRINFPLGILLLRSTSEELMSTRDDISSDRKKYFHSSLIQCMPEVFRMLTQFLVVYTYGVNGTDLSLLPNNLIDRSLFELLPTDNRLSLFTVELLKCIQHLLTWAPLSDVVHEQFLLNLFELGEYKEVNSDISVASLTAISELFYRQSALPFPVVIGTGMKNILRQRQLEHANEMYQDKLTELLRLFMAQQCSKWIEDETIFPELVAALYQYTFTSFSSYSTSAFTEKLTIWHPIIKGLETNGFNRYTQTMHLLVAGILNKLQVRYNPDLKELDNETLDDDMQTEWQQYLTQCIETIALVAEVRPIQVFEQVYSEWRRPFEVFESLQKSFDSNGTLMLEDNSRYHLVQSNLRDLSSLCQTLARLTSTLQQGCLQEIPANLAQITYSLIYAVEFIAVNKLHSVNLTNTMLNADFIDLFAQLLHSIRTLLTWSPILQNENELKAVIENSAQILMPPSNILQESKIVTLAAAQLILTIATALRPRFMLECSTIKQLVQCGNNLNYLDKQAALYIHNTIINCYVLPWANIPPVEQDFENRASSLQRYIQALAHDLDNLDNISEYSQQDKIVRITLSVLPTLKGLIDCYQDNSSSAKHMLVAAYKPIITKSMILFSHLGSQSEHLAECILNFSLSVIKTLQVQLGQNVIREMINVFFAAFNREQVTQNCQRAANKLLQILLLVVQQPGSLGTSLLPSILDFALNSVLPAFMHVPEKDCDVATSLYSLFDSVLHNRWQYFYKSQVSRGFSPVASDCSSPTEDMTPEHHEQFYAILQAYGQALVTIIDPHITRTLLVSLQSLNERWKLFNRDFFKCHLLPPFLVALINTLLSSNGAMHYDLLINVLFSMGMVNVDALRETFANLLPKADQKAVLDVCWSQDLPTFSVNVAKLIQDIKSNQILE